MIYQHPIQSQRYQIATLHKAGIGCRHIGNVFECPHSTVAREISRNRNDGRYRADHAQRQATRRRREASTCARIAVCTWDLIEKHLREEWSPEQIKGNGIAT